MSSKNTVGSCCWYALVMRMYRHHTKWKTTRNGGKILKALATTLSLKCYEEPHKPVDFNHIQNVKKALQCNMRIGRLTYYGEYRLC